MKKKVTSRPPIKRRDINRATRRATAVVMKQIAAAFSKKTATYRQLEEKSEPITGFDKLLKKFAEEGEEYEHTSFNPFLMPSDAHMYLRMWGSPFINGTWRPTGGQASDYVLSKHVGGKNNKMKYVEYGISHTLDAHPAYTWRDCLILVSIHTDYSHTVHVMIAPKGKLSRRLNEFQADYLRHCHIKGKYVEVWSDPHGGMSFEIGRPEQKIAIHEDHDQRKIDRVMRIIHNWDRLKTGERRMGFLLYGKPGTGKTATLAQLANRLEGRCTILNLKGGTRNSLLTLYDWLDRIGPNIVIVEDFDTIASSRDYGASDTSSFISLLLNTLDGARNHDVITIATTNYPENIDPAVTRPGRLGISIRLDDPTPELRRRIIDYYARQYEINLDLSSLDMDGVLGAHIQSILRYVYVETSLGADPQTAFNDACQAYFHADNINWKNGGGNPSTGFKRS